MTLKERIQDIWNFLGITSVGTSISTGLVSMMSRENINLAITVASGLLGIIYLIVKIRGQILQNRITRKQLKS